MDEARTAMVTGASRGIGRAVAVALAADGWDVAITGRTAVEGSGPDGLPGSLDSTAAAIEATGRRALPVELDLLDRDRLFPAVEAVLQAFGRLDVLVNNAVYGGRGRGRPFVDVEPTEVERELFANLTAQLLISHRALRAMVERGRGTVVNITSGAATTNPPGPTGAGGWALTYGCAKGGLHRMAGVLAAELGDRGIRCYNVQPGLVATERVRATPFLEWVAREGKPPEVVGAVVAWLLRQPDGVVGNGRTVEVDAVAPDIGLLPG